MKYQQLYDELKATIRGWIQDKIDSIHDHHAETLEARDDTAGYRNEAAQSASNAATSEANAANAVEVRVNALIANAPEALDTLNKFAEALGNDPNFATTTATKIGERAKTVDVNAALADKADKSELTTGLSGKAGKGAENTAQWAQVSGKPSTFPPVAHTHPIEGIEATGTPSATTFLRGDKTWATPPNTTYLTMNQATAEAGVSPSGNLISASVLKSAILYHSGPKSVTLTQAQYDALATKDPNVTYNIVAS